ncbi:glycosyltransferase [Microbacterium sp. SLBN-111]|uniref:glycosyltransferase n=1 Tax=Microbacterium sp. SLBN-111 TaxID=3377733 RepID=UPI003C726248
MVQTRGQVAVVLPAFNEAAALPVFLSEVRSSFAAHALKVTIIVVDDASTDDTAAAAAPFARVVRSPRNRGHGPTALAAYAAGLAHGAEVIVHVDGDGQFFGEDVVRVALALDEAEADVVHGVRRGRTDPWFRRSLSALVRLLVLLVCGRSVPDVNTPLRAYHPQALRELIEGVPADALIPHVHFSVAEARRHFRVRYVPVASIPRRGVDAQGTMWGTGRARRWMPPARLVRFAGASLAELWRVDIVGGRSLSNRFPRRDHTVGG